MLNSHREIALKCKQKMGLRATQCILNGINHIIMDKLAPRPLMFARTDGQTDVKTVYRPTNIVCRGYKKDWIENNREKVETSFSPL